MVLVGSALLKLVELFNLLNPEDIETHCFNKNDGKQQNEYNL